MSRFLLKLSESGHNVDESHKSSSKSLKFKKSMSIASRKSNSDMKSQDRLVGGADEPANTENETETKEVTVENSAEEETVKDAQPPKDPKDAVPVSPNGPCCTCLAGSTGDKNVDDMIDFVHKNLQEAGKALASLSGNFEHESKLMFADVLGRIKEWVALVQHKLDQCMLDLDALRKELMARACEIANLKKSLAECKEKEAGLKADLSKKQPVAEKQVETTAAPPPSQSPSPPPSPPPPPPSPPQPPPPPAQQPAPGQQSAPVQTTSMEQVVTRDFPMLMQQAPVQPATIEILCTDAAIQSVLKDKDGMRREMELEAEIARLRKENERIIKERAEYESAIQRALLRGVSSLNVEALRVLRCPPIPCCSPCAPCPTSTMKSNSTCKKDGPSVPKRCVTQQRIGCVKNGVHESNSYTVKQPCGSPCCPSGKSQQSVSSSSMIFLLHQNDTDMICNSKPKGPRVCGSPMMKKIEIPPCPRFLR